MLANIILHLKQSKLAEFIILLQLSLSLILCTCQSVGKQKRLKVKLKDLNCKPIQQHFTCSLLLRTVVLHEHFDTPARYYSRILKNGIEILQLIRLAKLSYHWQAISQKVNQLQPTKHLANLLSQENALSVKETVEDHIAQILRSNFLVMLIEATPTITLRELSYTLRNILPNKLNVCGMTVSGDLQRELLTLKTYTTFRKTVIAEK